MSPEDLSWPEWVSKLPDQFLSTQYKSVMINEHPLEPYAGPVSGWGYSEEIDRWIQFVGNDPTQFPLELWSKLNVGYSGSNRRAGIFSQNRQRGSRGLFIVDEVSDFYYHDNNKLDMDLFEKNSNYRNQVKNNILRMVLDGQ